MARQCGIATRSDVGRLSGRGACIFGLGLALVLSAATPCRAAFISEVYLSDGSAGDPSTAVEVEGLDAQSGRGADLIVIDAAPLRHGRVQRAITLPTSERVQLVSESAWPTGKWVPAPLSSAAPTRTTLSDLNEGDSFGLSWARTLLLYDQPTGVSDAGTTNLFTQKQPDSFHEATLLDSLTLSIDGAVPAVNASGPVVALNAGEAMVRPIDQDANPRLPRVGVPDSNGVLAGIDPQLKLTPGWLNPEWEASEPLPEPGTGAILGLCVAALALRRHRRHCSNRSGRL